MTGVDIFGRTDVGRIRSNNEDQFFVASLHKGMKVQQTSLGDPSRFDKSSDYEAYLLMVADGVGGLAGGEIASGLAVQTVGELVAQATGCFYEFDVAREHEFLDQLETAVRKTHEVVRATFGGKQGPATTLTLVTLLWPRAYIVHIGDSRCYYLHDGRLRQITQDQTMGALLVDEGVMNEEEAGRGSLHDILTSAIGGEITPAIGLIDLDLADVLMICSDGLTKHVGDDLIRTILAEGTTAEGSCNRLVEAALDGGGSDNVTVVVARK